MIDELELDLGAHTVAVSAEAVHLTPTEYALLRTLVRNRGRLIVANLRHKIEPGPSKPRYLTTDPRIGYRFAR